MTLSRRTVIWSAAAALAGAASPARAFAAAPASLRGVAIEAARDGVRAALALDGGAACQTFFLSDPDRFVIDLAEARLALPTRGAGAGLVLGYRAGERPGGVARVVLDLAAPARLVRQERGARRAPSLSFDLAADAPAADPLQRRETPGRESAPRRIVIDAGHGGHDPGAIGVTGVREKDVVLDAALQVRRALEARGRYRVALTRDDDTFVPLEDRVRFARAQGADLFISLHADSHARAEACGASVYTLSERGADRAQTVMTAQDWRIGEAPRRGVVGQILVDLTQRETTNRSAEFAQTLIPKLAQAAPLLSNTHRSAGFFVLLAPDVPAVLIETGFLSNPSDERRLSDPAARAAIAGAIADAVDAYFDGSRVSAGRV